MQRVIIFSAPIGEGHDAAASAVAASLREEGVEVECVNGLALLGGPLERLVRGVYGTQLRRAQWSWALLYRLLRARRLVALLGTLLALYGGRRLVRRIEAARSDRVLSTYPVVSAVLAALRRRGRLRVACASLITDFDPHPAWIHPDLDANLSVAPSPGAQQVEPPLRTGRGESEDRADVRERLGLRADERLVLVTGGAWGVGNLGEAAQLVASLPGFHAVVVTGRNEELRERLARDLAGRRATVLGYVTGLRGLVAAADAIVQHAGGVTCLEAFAAGVPVIAFDPLPGHGRANARHMARAGVLTVAETVERLNGLLRSTAFWGELAPATARCGWSLFAHPSVATRLRQLAPRMAGVTAPAPVARPLLYALGIGLVVWLVLDPSSASWAGPSRSLLGT